MKKFAFTIIIKCLLMPLYAQIPITFDKNINGHNGGSIFEYSNRYEIFLDAYSSDYARMITDKEGYEQGIQTYGGPSVEFLTNATQTPDKGYVLVGNSYSYLYPDMAAVYFAFAVKIDSNGVFQWQKVYSFPDFTERGTIFYSGASTSDGGYIFAGRECCDSVIDPNDWMRPGLYVVKTDSLGNEQWHIMDTTLTDSYYYNTPVVESPLHDGYYIATNYVDSIITVPAGWPRCDKYFLIKTDLQGNYVWTKGYYPLSAYDPMAYYSFKDILVTDHHTLILLGSGIVMETDLNGNELWRKEHVFGYTFSGRIHKVPWGGYITCQDAFIHYIGEDGTIIWERGYNNIASFRDIIPTQDGGFLALIHDPGGRLVKMDCEGNVINPVACVTGIETSLYMNALEVNYTQAGWTIKRKEAISPAPQLFLYDILGNQIASYSFVGGIAEIANKALAKGVYFVRCGEDGQSIKLLNY